MPPSRCSTAQRCSAAPRANGTGAWTYTTARLPMARTASPPPPPMPPATPVWPRPRSAYHRHHCAGCPEHCLVLDRQRHLGDGITSDNTLTLTGTAEANATVKVFDGATLLGTATATAPAPGPIPLRARRWRPQPHSHRHRHRRQHRRGLGRARRHHRYHRAGCPEHRLVSTDSGVAGDGLTNDNTLTLTALRKPKRPSRSRMAQRCSAPQGKRHRRLDLYDSALPWRAHPHSHCHRCRRQHRRGLPPSR